GLYEVGVRVQNQDGDWGMTETRPLLVVDIGPPTITVLEGNPINLNRVTLQVVFDEDVNSFVEADVMVSPEGAVVNGSFATVNASTYTVELDLLTEGIISVDIADSAAFTNDDNSPSPKAVTYDIFYDITSPTVGIDALTTTDLTPMLTGTIDDDSASVSITLDGSVYSASSVTGGVWTLNQGVITPLAAGVYDVEVTATDVAGNIGTDATTDELTINSTALIALPATLVTDTSFVANWGGGIDVMNYELDISEVADFSTFLAGFESLTTTATSDTLIGVDFGTTYYYRVRSVNTSSVVSANSNVETATTIIDPLTEADSTALVQIYTALDGANWSPAVNWETDRFRNWDGVSLDPVAGRRVDVVDVSGRVATGTMPSAFTGGAIGGLSDMTQMNISNNAIDGLIDFSSTAINNLNVSGNDLDFDDLEPLVGIPTFVYTNQSNILFNEDAGGVAIEVDHLADTIISINTGGAANSYSFTRNGTVVTQGADFNILNDTLEILSIDFDNMGEFAASVTNSLLPDLTLQVTPQIVHAVADLSMTIVDQSDDLLADPISGYLMEAFRREQGFDTLEVADDVSSSFIFPDVVLGDYLIGIDPSNRDLFIPTYFGDQFEWELADTLEFREASTIQVRMTQVPEDEPPGEGLLSVLIEEDFGDDGGRIDARRRAARRKCGLKKRRSGGRDEQDEFDLFAYGETDDNGEFQFGFLPEGVYRFFVEYPGIPLDDNAFVQFEVGEFGVSDTEFSLTAFATEEGIEVSIERVLGIIFDYFKNLKVYPNPASEAVNITFRHLKSKTVSAQLVDLTGNIFWTKEIEHGFDGNVRIDVSSFSEGVYLLHIYDRESRNKNVVTYRILVKE
ncbi:MAG: T9SS type A sorting domain-containing protein, partial [Bacteroidota bacterium]